MRGFFCDFCCDSGDAALGDADAVRRAMRSAGGFSCYGSYGFFLSMVSAPDFGICAGCFSGAAALRGGSDGSFSLLCFDF